MKSLAAIAYPLMAALFLSACGGGGGVLPVATVEVPEPAVLLSLQAPRTIATEAPFDLPSTVLLDLGVLLDPDAPRNEQPEPFTVTGEGFGPVGETCVVRFEARGSLEPFNGSAQVEVIGAIDSDTTITGLLPVFEGGDRLPMDMPADIRIVLPDGREASAVSLVVFKAPPRIESFENLRAPTAEDGTLSHIVLPSISTAIEIRGANFDLSGADVTLVVFYGDTLVSFIQLEDQTITSTSLTGASVPLDADDDLWALLEQYGEVAITLGILNNDGQYATFEASLGSAAAPAYGTDCSLPNVAAIATTGSNAGTGIAIDPTDPQRAVSVSNGGRDAEDPYVLAARSADAGLSWTTVQVGSAASAQPDASALPADAFVLRRQDPQIAVDRAGNFYLAYFIRWWEEKDLPEPTEEWQPDPSVNYGESEGVMVMRSLDGGATWQDARLLLEVSAATTITSQRFALAVGADGNATEQDILYAATSQAENWNSRVYVTSLSIDGEEPGQATTPSPASQQLSAYEAFCAHPDLAVGPEGELYVGWAETGDPGKTSLWVNRDLDGLAGNTHSLDPDEANAVDANTNECPLWGAGSASTGGQPLLAMPCIEVIAAGDLKGRVVVAWTGSTGAPRLEIFVRHSDDGGATWSEAGTINSADEADQHHVQLASDPTTGHLYASWYDASPDELNEQPSGLLLHRFAASSHDGARWTAPLCLSQGASNAALADGYGLGQDTGLAAYGRAIWAAWADNSGFTEDNPDGEASMDVYVTLFTLEPDAP